PDYDQLFKCSLIPAAPAVFYVPFDRPIVLGDQKAKFLELSMLRGTLVLSTERNTRVQFSIYPQDYPEPASVSYQDAPVKPAGEITPEPESPRAPELRDFLPPKSVLTKRFSLLYWIQCQLAGGVTRERLRAAKEAFNEAEATMAADLKRI